MGDFGWKYRSIGVLLASVFRLWRAISCSSIHDQDPLLLNFLSGSVTVDSLGRNFAKYDARPFSLFTSSMHCGFGICTIAFVFSSSAISPSLVSLWPKNGTSLQRSLRLCLFNTMPVSLHLLRNVFSLLSWSFSASSMVASDIRISSAIQRTPCNPSRASFSRLWKISLDTLRPKGSRRYLYLPCGVMNVVKLLDSSSSFKWW